MNWRTWRVIVSHLLAAVGMGLPWPVLLVVVDAATGAHPHAELLLGGAAALRMLPYVALSWLSGRLADRRERARIVRLSMWLRAGLLAGAGLGLATGQWGWALAACTGAVVAGTPAYPALAAGMPRLAGAATRRATGLLVTVEVSSFVVGPALGGLLVDRVSAHLIALMAAGLVALAVPFFGRTVLPAPEHEPDAPVGGVARLLMVNRSARHALAVVAGVNAVLAGLGLALLPLAEAVWGNGAAGFGVATAVLGFGSLAAPLVGLTPPVRTARGGLLVLGGAVLLFAAVPAGAVALGVLGLVGAVAVCCESVATGVLQRAVPDSLRSSVLGLADTVMVAAAMLAALVTPTLAAGFGPILCFVVGGLGTMVLGISQRSSRALSAGSVLTSPRHRES